MVPRNNGQEKKMRKGRGGMKWRVGVRAKTEFIPSAKPWQELELQGSK